MSHNDHAIAVPRDNRVRILSYNMWGVPFLDTGKKARFKRFLKEVIETQDRYDVYCFQEVFSSRRGFFIRWIPFIFVALLYGMGWIFSVIPTKPAQKISSMIYFAGRCIDNFIGTGLDMIEGKFWSVFACIFFFIPADSPKNPFYWTNHYDKIQFLNSFKKRWGQVYFVQSKLSLHPFKFVDSGLLIVSRFPMQKVGEVTYNTLVDEDVLATKGALFAVVDVPSSKGTEKVAICTTHLQAGYGEGKRMDIRNQQIGIIAQNLNDIVCKDGALLSSYPCVVTGDFNLCCHKDMRHYYAMLDTFNRVYKGNDLKDTVAIFQPDALTEGDRRVDFILTNLFCESSRVMDYRMSDHLAIEACLVLPEHAVHTMGRAS